MSAKLSFTLAFFFCIQFSLGQLIFRQDIVQGGITAGGFSTGLGAGTGTIELYIEPESEVQAAYLISYSHGDPLSSAIVVNEINYFFNNSEKVTEYGHVHPYITPISIYTKDITDDISPTDTQYEITIPPQDAYNGYFTAFIVVVYENPLLPTCAYSIIVNEDDNTGNDTFQPSELNPIHTGFPAGIALYTDRAGLPNISGSNVYISSNHLGLIYGSDSSSSSWNGAGVRGHFYYQNNEFSGLDDDVANAGMSGSDGIADVSSYLNPLEMSFELNITHVAFPNNTAATTNHSIGLFLAYTTPCQPFATTLTEEVETCRGDTAHLLATGGQDYKWLPEEDLSCYNCPNPVFEGDSSKIYTVRIWNTDSCSKVLPVKVNVLDVPDNVNIATTPATCSESDGEISLSGVSGGQSPYQYNIGGNWTTNPSANMFSILEAGDYTLTVKDENNCTLEQDFTIAEENPANAVFSANPQSGTEPLDVQFNNQSSGTMHYEWSLGDSTFNDFEFNFTFDSAGSYPVQLISWYNEPHCADTAMATIIVHPDYNHSIFMPTLYSAQIGDFFIQTTNIQRVEFELYNAIGQRIFSTEVEVTDGENNLWNGSNHALGYYFFRLKYWDIQGLEFSERGKVLLVR